MLNEQFLMEYSLQVTESRTYNYLGCTGEIPSTQKTNEFESKRFVRHFNK
jgi:hypothetical protein